MNGKITLSNKLKGAVTMANTIINGGASPYPKGASGSIITITDGADNTPLKSCVVNIEPVQDLHGYSYPWPAGGGFNKLNITDLTPIKNENGITFTVNANGTITANGTATSQCQIYWQLPKERAATYGGLKATIPSTGKGTLYLELAGAPYTHFLQSPAYIVDNSIADVTQMVNCIWRIPQGTTLSNYTYGPMLYDASLPTPTSFSPFSNICPISGWTQVNVVAAGVNLCDLSFKHGIYVISTGARYNHEGSSTRYVSIGEIPVKGGQTYTISWKNDPTNTATLYNLVFFSRGTFLQGGTTTNRTFTAPVGADSVGITLLTTTAITSISQIAIAEPQLVVGSTAQPYAAPTLTPTTIPLGQTVYGGTLDMVRGKLNVKPYYASYSGQTLVGPWISSHDKYVAGATLTTGAQVVDMGAAGTEYDVTPQTIKTLLGTNNIWADAGEMSIEYYPAAASIVAVQNRSTKMYVSIPLGMIRYETYQITPQQTIDLDSYRSENGNLLRNPVATKCKLEFNTPLMTDSQWGEIWNIIKAGFNNNTERKLKLKYYDTLSATYKTGYFYVPDVQTTIRNIEEGPGVINYQEIRLAFIEY